MTQSPSVLEKITKPKTITDCYWTMETISNIEHICLILSYRSIVLLYSFLLLLNLFTIVSKLDLLLPNPVL